MSSFCNTDLESGTDRFRSWNWPQIRDQHTRFTQGVKFQLIWVTLRKWPWIRFITLNQGLITSDHETDLKFVISTLDLLRMWSFSSFEWLWENDPESGSPWFRVWSDHETDLKFVISTLDLLRVWSFSWFEWLWENDPDSWSSPWIRN